jgi:iron complex transport system substrate-binding protein
VTSHTSQGDSKVKVSSVDRVLALSLSGSLAEYVYTLGMGDSLVGKDVSTDFPGSGDLPLVTHEGHSIDPEAVLNLDPTLIITDGSIGPIDVVEQLADAGVPVVFVDGAETFEQSYTQAQQIADALGVSAVADKVVSELKEAIAKKEKEIARLVPADENKRPRVAFLYMRGKGVFYLFGEGSGVDSLFKSEQVTDVAKEINWKGQRPMNDEALVKANPDTILVMTGGLKSVGGIDGMLETHPAVALTDAGKNKRIIDVDDTSLFTGGMRVPDILDGLARAFYAPDTLQ